jgi:hypothetical protein
MWNVPASEVELRVTRTSLLDLLVIKRPGDLWEMRLPRIQPNLAGFGRTLDEALDALLNLFALHAEYSESRLLSQHLWLSARFFELESDVPASGGKDAEDLRQASQVAPTVRVHDQICSLLTHEAPPLGHTMVFLASWPSPPIAQGAPWPGEEPAKDSNPVET